mmetsp:Transcript_34883/g.75597  ORF Transcript_34883/g.75597 Transcript_34883/m.75597 type:complete len:221 (-) Transcript_34883:75-737(-)
MKPCPDQRLGRRGDDARIGTNLRRRQDYRTRQRTVRRYWMSRQPQERASTHSLPHIGQRPCPCPPLYHDLLRDRWIQSFHSGGIPRTGRCGLRQRAHYGQREYDGDRSWAWDALLSVAPAAAGVPFLPLPRCLRRLLIPRQNRLQFRMNYPNRHESDHHRCHQSRCCWTYCCLNLIPTCRRHCCRPPPSSWIHFHSLPPADVAPPAPPPPLRPFSDDGTC